MQKLLYDNFISNDIRTRLYIALLLINEKSLELSLSGAFSLQLSYLYHHIYNDSMRQTNDTDFSSMLDAETLNMYLKEFIAKQKYVKYVNSKFTKNNNLKVTLECPLLNSEMKITNQTLIFRNDFNCNKTQVTDIINAHNTFKEKLLLKLEYTDRRFKDLIDVTTYLLEGLQKEKCYHGLMTQK